MDVVPVFGRPMWTVIIGCPSSTEVQNRVCYHLPEGQIRGSRSFQVLVHKSTVAPIVNSLGAEVTNLIGINGAGPRQALNIFYLCSNKVIKFRRIDEGNGAPEESR